MSRIVRSRLLVAMGIGLVAFAAFSLAGSAFGQASTWTNAVNGVWTNPAMWSAAGVPNTNAANLTAGNGSYTVTVDAPLANPIFSLTITNKAGNTTLLDINAAGFAISNGFLTLGRGALLSVNAGGVMTYPWTNATPTPFISIENGGEWKVNGGTVDFNNIMYGGTGARSYINVGNGSTGTLTISSGLFDFRGRNDITGSNGTVFLQIGNGAAGNGIMQMNGGTANIFSTGQNGLYVGGGGSRGEVTLTNYASLVVSNWLSVGASGGTGIVTVAGNATARFTGRLVYGCDVNNKAVINVQDNGYFSDAGGSWFGAYGGGNGGIGVLNISGGRYSAGGGVKVCDCGANTAGYGEINLTGGILELGAVYGYGVDLCTPRGSNSFPRAVLNISGTGLLKIPSLWNGATYGSGNGLVVGKAKSGSPFSSGYGRVNMSGGTITNLGVYTVGAWPGGTGEVYQTGGTVWQRGYALVVGFGGGTGIYSMAGGTYWSDVPVFVGGVTTTDLGYVPNADFTNASAGVLNVSSGTLQTTAGLYVGDWGAGTLTIGSNGQVKAGNLIMTNNGSSKLRFEVATDGAAGQLVVTNKLTVYPGAKLEVYVPRSYVPDVPVKVLTLATYATNVGSFADVTVSNYPGATVVQTTTKIQVRIPSRQGTLILIR